MTTTINASTAAGGGLINSADASGILALQTGGTTAITIDGSQNVGVGVTPSAWSSSYKSIELSRSGNSLTSLNAAGIQLRSNAYLNSSSINTYANNGFAAYYEQYNSGHYWYTAPSGTAGNAITFTQAMTLDASGNLSVGMTNGAGKMNIGAGGSFRFYRPDNATYGEIYRSSTTGFTFNDANSDVFTWLQGGSERARINSSGVLCVGTTGLSNNGNAASFYGSGPVVRIYGTSEGSGPLAIDKSTATSTTAQQFINFTINNQGTGSGQINANGASQAAFGSFSDERLKENIVDLAPQLSNVLALRPVEFDYKAGGHQTGFIAQEMQQVFPDAVGEDGSENNYLTVTGWNKTEAILVKAIQEQQAMIASQSEQISSQAAVITTLTERITALEGTK